MRAGQLSRSGGGVCLGGVLAALAVLAAACGGGHQSGGGNPSTTAAPNTTPKPGGKLVMGTEAEIDGLDPTQNHWDATGYMYAQSVFDPLTAVAADGSVKPYLAQSLTTNAYFTVWTIKLRPGISFSDGEPLNADAVVFDLTAQKASSFTGKALADVTSISKVDDTTVTVTMAKPWSVFPMILTSQIGYIAAPRQLADPKGAPRHPIGTGPFILTDWVPGSHLSARKNPSYWRSGLPYLDSIEFRPVPDSQARENSLKSGVIDLFHTTDARTILDFRGSSSFHVYEQTNGRVEENFVMINVTKPPLDDLRVRQALAYATDTARYDALANYGILKPANGPFSSGSGYTNDPGYPTYNLQRAKDLVAAYEKDKGVAKVSFELGTTNVATNATDTQILATMWRQAGIDVTVTQAEQSQLILNAVEGKYAAYGWRQFGEVDPDLDYLWWHSNATGATATNFARNHDLRIDKDLEIGRSTLDLATRRAAYEDISVRLNKNLPYIWTNEVVWDIVAKPTVEGILTPTLPDGSPQRALSSGTFPVTAIWIDH